VTARIRVLLVDDQPLFREGLAALLSRVPEIEIAGESANGREAVDAVAELTPDVVLMDLRMPGMDGVTATRALTTRYPAVRVLALTTFDDDELIFEALRAGAAGYLLKDSPLERLVEAVGVAATGQSFLQPSVATKVIAELARRDPPPAPASAEIEALSERERAVLGELARGASNREIARRLQLAEGTVKNYVSAILAKLDAPDRINAALKARDLGLV
jgi:DNA-binding NarL/FixJ family response regulator